MGLVGGYSIHLYCDSPNNDSCPYPEEFIGQTQDECIFKARQLGWYVNIQRRNRVKQPGRGYCLCPVHNKEREEKKDGREDGSKQG
jgi:hypothetical protein